MTLHIQLFWVKVINTVYSFIYIYIYILRICDITPYGRLPSWNGDKSKRQQVYHLTHRYVSQLHARFKFNWSGFLTDCTTISNLKNKTKFVINSNFIEAFLIFYFLFALDLSIYLKKAVAHLEWKVFKPKFINFIVLKPLCVKKILFICINCSCLYHMKRYIIKYLKSLVYYLNSLKT